MVITGGSGIVIVWFGIPQLANAHSPFAVQRPAVPGGNNGDSRRLMSGCTNCTSIPYLANDRLAVDFPQY